MSGAKFGSDVVGRVAAKVRKEAAKSGVTMTQEQARARVGRALDTKQKRKER